MSRKGNLFIVAAPSGAGKTSLVKALEAALANIKISISHTTRPIRPGEQDGVDYHFVNETQFSKMVAEHAFLEYAQVYGFHYGTSRNWVLTQLQQGTDVLLEIDWQGAAQICQQFPPAVSIFILPPSREALRARLVKRAQDNEQVIEKRMTQATSEMAHYQEFMYLVVNDDFTEALQDLQHIIVAQRLQCAIQQKILASLLADLLKSQ